MKEEKKLQVGTRLKYLGILAQLCAIAGNAVVAAMRSHPITNTKLPHGSGKAGKKSFRLETVLAFLEVARARAEQSKDWWDVVAYGLAAFAAGFGARPKELRALKVSDLEQYCWRLRVGFSKTHPDYTTMLPPIQSHIENYLELRAARITDGNPLLFPQIKGKGIRISGGTVTANQVREMFQELGAVAGVDIAPKDMRTSYGQILMDFGAGIETTSRMMRHASVATTQRWYVDLRPDGSFEQLEILFSNPPAKNKNQDKYIEGYR